MNRRRNQVKLSVYFGLKLGHKNYWINVGNFIRLKVFIQVWASDLCITRTVKVTIHLYLTEEAFFLGGFGNASPSKLQQQHPHPLRIPKMYWSSLTTPL